MVMRRKPLPAESPAQPESYGLNLEVQWSEKVRLQLRLSEAAVLRLTPLLIGVLLGSAGTWLVNYPVPSALPPSPPAAVQPRK